MKISNTFYRLKSHVRHYDWGVRRHGDAEPYIAELLGVEGGDDKPWAELWMGAHPSLPSELVVEDGTYPLDKALAENADAVGYVPAGLENGRLPFLLKVLSCECPLSIQSHPDKKTAEKLHAEHPENYPDDNHKPEIMIALTPFQALAGFRKLEDAVSDLSSLACLAPWAAMWGTIPDMSMRVLCDAVLNMPEMMAEQILTSMQLELNAMGNDSSESGKLFLKLLEKNPGDRGALFAFLLKHWTMNPGEAMFIPANEPHAYLSGTGIECMANSDNVIRAGLTRKFVDIQTLMETLDFGGLSMEVIQGTKKGIGERIYETPAKEYQVTILSEGASLSFAERRSTAGILLVLEGAYTLDDGAGKILRAERGSTWFRPATLTAATIKPVDGNCKLVLAEVGK